MYDDSGISLSASDPNPSIDQFDDGGSSADFSSLVNSAGAWGTEIASVITGNRPAPAVTPYYSGTYSGGPLVRPTATSGTTKLLIAGLVIAGVFVVVKQLG